jgi:hypothetical protein
VKLPAYALVGAAAAALAAGVAAEPAKAPANSHVMTVPLADGSTVHVQYVGDVAPKVTIAPAALADPLGAWAAPFPSFAGFDRMIQEMQRRSQQMIGQARQMAAQPVGSAPYVASYGSLPAGGTSTSVISVSNGGATCTRTTEVVSQGPGKPPKVTSSVSGQCAAAPQPPAASGDRV